MEKSLFLVLALAVMLTACAVETDQQEEAAPEVRDAVQAGQTYKVLHVMSYHSPWKWTDDQLEGFKDALQGLDVEYKVFQMDTKRKSSDDWKVDAGNQAKDLVESWQPDLVYTNDDNAQKYFVVDYVGSDIPFVFSAVNADPSVYGFRDSPNVAGVLEQEHFVQTVHLLNEIDPDIKRIAIIYDDDPTWPAVIERMKAKAENQLPEYEMVSWDRIETYAAYQQRILELQDEADAIGLIGIFTFKDEDGENVPYQEVLEWTAENSQLPDFSFWADRISYGTLAAMTVSGYEQGYAAGQIARGILADGKKPSEFTFEPTTKGEPVVSLARARKLNITLTSDILLSAEIVDTFGWE